MKKVGRQFNLDGRIMAVQRSIEALKEGMEVLRDKKHPDCGDRPSDIRCVDLVYGEDVGEEA